jgi:ABC-type uncharacterized transport system substrate-binding protein
MRSYAAELVGLEPDVLVAAGGAAIGPLSRASGTVPIVFEDLDFSTRAIPILNIQSLARPGGKATGFLSLPYTISGKWLELLKQIAPLVTRAAVLFANGNPVSADQLSIINDASRSSAVEVIPVDIHDPTTLERRITGYVREPDGGMILTMSPPSDLYRGLIINLAARNQLPERLELLHRLVPKAVRIAVLLNPAQATNAETTLQSVQEAARVIGLQIHVLNASTSSEIDAAFDTLAGERPDGRAADRKARHGYLGEP